MYIYICIYIYSLQNMLEINFHNMSTTCFHNTRKSPPNCHIMQTLIVSDSLGFRCFHYILHIDPFLNEAVSALEHMAIQYCVMVYPVHS